MIVADKYRQIQTDTNRYSHILITYRHLNLCKTTGYYSLQIPVNFFASDSNGHPRHIAFICYSLWIPLCQTRVDTLIRSQTVVASYISGSIFDVHMMMWEDLSCNSTDFSLTGLENVSKILFVERSSGPVKALPPLSGTNQNSLDQELLPTEVVFSYPARSIYCVCFLCKILCEDIHHGNIHFWAPFLGSLRGAYF